MVGLGWRGLLFFAMITQMNEWVKMCIYIQKSLILFNFSVSLSFIFYPFLFFRVRLCLSVLVCVCVVQCLSVFVRVSVCVCVCFVSVCLSPRLAAFFACTDHKRAEVVSGRVTTADLRYADVALRKILRVPSKCCLFGKTFNALLLLTRAWWVSPG